MGSNSKEKKVETIKEESAKEDTINLKVITEEYETPTAEVTKKVGIVVGCQDLNVRAEPSIEAEIVSILHRDSEVSVHEKTSTEEFYKVGTSAGIDGYCMRRYIKIKK
jgi:uncharacterized protein YgiM (DUF1202 family)